MAITFETRESNSAASLGGAELRAALALKYGVSAHNPDGWKLASKLSETEMEWVEGPLKEEALRLATHAVIRRACRMVGPLRVSKRRQFGVMREPFRGELDVERTLENTAGKDVPDADDWIAATREEHERAVCLMMDASLSMSGRNLALAALAAAVLALKIPEGDLTVIAFDSMARVVTRLGEERRADQVVKGILSLPARGYTNLEDALATGWRELARARCARRVGVLITDGVYTVGGDPSAAAARFPVLHVMMTQDYKVNEELCRKMARLGHGELFRVERFEDMPARMLELVNRL